MIKLKNRALSFDTIIKYSSKLTGSNHLGILSQVQRSFYLFLATSKNKILFFVSTPRIIRLIGLNQKKCTFLSAHFTDLHERFCLFRHTNSRILAQLERSWTLVLSLLHATGILSSSFQILSQVEGKKLAFGVQSLLASWGEAGFGLFIRWPMAQLYRPLIQPVFSKVCKVQVVQM